MRNNKFLRLILLQNSILVLSMDSILDSNSSLDSINSCKTRIRRWWFSFVSFFSETDWIDCCCFSKPRYLIEERVEFSFLCRVQHQEDEADLMGSTTFFLFL